MVLFFVFSRFLKCRFIDLKVFGDYVVYFFVIKYISIYVESDNVILEDEI